MKKSILAVAALIVVCAGVFFACSKDEPKVEDTTASSSVSSESAVSEESTSEAESQAEQEETINTVAEVEEAQGEASETAGASGEDTITKDLEEAASLASEAKKTYDAETEALIQKFVDSYGYTREAAIKTIEESRSKALAQAEKENKERWAQYNAEMEERNAKADQDCIDKFGITVEEWRAMSIDEQNALKNKLGL